ncbi:MAG TPA: ADOP family duplicated permease [Myxococcaceae bacterium]|nr:ADOP family duplicated permease [Myxococcaceae bacterium]
MYGLARDLRSAFRQLRVAPGLSAAVILALALGIGANAALFAIVEALELRPLPLGDPERLVAIGLRPRVRADQLPGPLSVPDAQEIAQGAPRLASLATWRRETFAWTRQSEARKVNVLLAGPGLFKTLGLPLQMGRDIEPGEVGPSAAHVAVVTDRFWRTQLGGSPSVLGSTLDLDGEPYQIVGVVAPGAEFPLSETPADVVLPLGVTPFTRDNMQHQGADIVRAVGRLAPGATLAEVRAEVRAAFDRVIEAHPSSAPEIADVVPFRRSVLGGREELPLLLLAATGFVLLIACVNVANLLLARAVRRRRELAVRAALGASLGDLRRQLLVESGVLALLAAGGAVLLSALLLSASVPLGPRAGSVVASYRIDGGVLGFAALLAAVCGLACGAVAGAFALPRELRSSLQASASGATAGAHERVRSTLVVLEVALSVVLLVGAGLLGRTMFRLASVDPGIRIPGLVAQELAVPDTTSDPELRRLLDSELERVSALPGVEAVGAIRPSPYGGGAMTTGARTSDLGDLWPETLDFRLVTPGTFAVLGAPILAGRDFVREDGPDRPPVLVVNQSLARRLWPGQDPIGQHLAVGLQDHEMRTVVGVVGDIRQSLDAPPRPEVYLPMGQVIDSKHDLVVRTRAMDPALLAALSTSLQGIHPQLLASTPVPFSVRVQQALLERRLAAMASLGFAAVALFLAALGIGGVLSQLVTQRTRELGIRMALGARAADVARLVLGRGLLLAATGLVLGAGVALVLGPALRRFLYGVGTLDVFSYAGAVVMLLAVAAAASWLPARRASRVDPGEVMRAE